ncbi:MAG: hypothetical protein LUD43_07090 [Firmicutes bacterium]|nr:hypothetical protein [Bacillota bacterium]
MKLHLLDGRAVGGFCTFGSVWSAGEVTPGSDFVLTGEDGGEIPVDSRVTAYYPDGSVKWAAHTADSALLGKSAEILPKGASDKSASCVGLTETDGEYILRTDGVSAVIPKHGSEIMRTLIINGKARVLSASPAIIIERRGHDCEGETIKRISGAGVISDVICEARGGLEYRFRIEGRHRLDTGEEIIPFIIRISFFRGSDRISISHTFIYDGDESRDFLGGIGVKFTVPVSGKTYNRHIKFAHDGGVFHEALSLLSSWRPRIPDGIYRAEMRGEKISDDFTSAAENMPVWREYQVTQDSDEHFTIRKKTAREGFCTINCLHGRRGSGALAVGGENGGVILGISEFREKYPSGLEASGLDGDEAELFAWAYSPRAESYDFRHYTDTGYSETYYEGFPEMGADPVGIANTRQIYVGAFDEIIPADEKLIRFADIMNRPPIYVGDAGYYHEKKAFGYWSLPSFDTPAETWLENQLSLAFEFYKNEVKQRRWYGIFDYGDVMHTYDSERHTWKYDMGGFAWQNTELVPTMWLWLYFMRTGRGDVFDLAEAMCRHTSDVDIYHIGKYRGIGSRHNVRHWGCACKEARIAMAGHHRYYYYLTGDMRISDVFGDVKDAEASLSNIDPLRYFYKKEDMTYPTHARSGPDWSSLVSDWMTEWERTGSKKYLDKILTGIDDIKKAPLRLISGPDFEFDPESCHLRYIGERAAGGTHLQICMGAAETWLELSLLLDESLWDDMLVEYGQFYFLDRESQLEKSHGLIGKRQFSFPYMASAVGAYSAMKREDEGEAAMIWDILIGELTRANPDGFVTRRVEGSELSEIPWISTNFVSQWCLNVIMALEFIRKYLPNKVSKGV